MENYDHKADVDIQTMLVLIENTRNALISGVYTQEREMVELAIRRAEAAVKSAWACAGSHDVKLVRQCVNCNLSEDYSELVAGLTLRTEGGVGAIDVGSVLALDDHHLKALVSEMRYGHNAHPLTISLTEQSASALAAYAAIKEWTLVRVLEDTIMVKPAQT